jgi:hypothetical protein
MGWDWGWGWEWGWINPFHAFMPLLCLVLLGAAGVIVVRYLTSH